MTEDDGQIEAGSEPDALAPGQWLDDLRHCLMFLTRLPVPQPGSGASVPLSKAVRAFPLVGAIVGAASGCALLMALGLGLSSTIAASLAVLTAIMMTGGLHEDGLADIADGFGGGTTVARKLAIMRDSRIGTYGVLALIFTVLLKVLAVAALLTAQDSAWRVAAALVAAAAISRAAMAVMMQNVEPARRDGRAAEAGRPTATSVRQAIGLAGLFGGFILWFSYGFWPMLAVGLAGMVPYFAIKRITLRQIGGQTGDVLGATQQLTEVVILVTLVSAAV